MNSQDVFRVAGIGELLFDLIDGAEHLGGAPLNFACHAASFGARGMVISSIGDDERGARGEKILMQRGIDTSGISVVSEYPTGTVVAQLDQQGVASYHFPDDVAWDHLVVNNAARSAAGGLDAVCFGSLVQRTAFSHNALLSYLDLLPPKTLKVFDVNLRQQFYSTEIIEASLERCDIVKLNEEELSVMAEMFGLAGNPSHILNALVEKHALKMGILTLGGEGSVIVGEDGESTHPGHPGPLVDTIGAGDSFTAVVTLGYLAGLSLDEMNDHANRVAAWVCGQHGATPVLPPELRIF